ncbi:hypothetical protein MJN69_28740, partial [Salmonella enterica subsp. enterica serovar Kentucky]|nr:hypothetical protein [Salmonella enterica subsp. enterica serovar Kentucky]
NIIDQVISTDRNNGTNMILYVPKGDDHDNWPFPIYEGPFIGKGLPSAGVGYRFEFKPRVNVRLDYGVGKASSGFYFQVGEAF